MRENTNLQSKSWDRLTNKKGRPKAPQLSAIV
jgi:hypothetical protein